MTQVHRDVTVDVFPEGFKLVRPQDGGGERKVRFAVFDDGGSPLASSEFTVQPNGDIYNADGQLVKSGETGLVTAMQAFETALGALAADLNE